MSVNAVVIPTGLDIDEFRATSPRDPSLRRYGVPPGRRVVLFLGRLHKKKGLDLLARAFIGLAAGRRDLQLVIAGPDEGMAGEIKEMFARARCTAQVSFTGLLNGQDKINLVAAADVMVIPSYTENFGNVVIEAMALAVPIVVSNGVGIADQVAKAAAGVVVNPSAHEVETAIGVVLDDRERALAMGRSGRALVERAFSWKSVGLQMEALYRGLARSRGNLSEGFSDRAAGAEHPG